MASVIKRRTSPQTRARLRNNKSIPSEYYRGLKSLEYYIKKNKDLKMATDIVCEKFNIEAAKLNYYFYSKYSVNQIRKMQGLPPKKKKQPIKKQQPKELTEKEKALKYIRSERRSRINNIKHKNKKNRKIHQVSKHS